MARKKGIGFLINQTKLEIYENFIDVNEKGNQITAIVNNNPTEEKIDVLRKDFILCVEDFKRKLFKFYIYKNAENQNLRQNVRN